MGKATVRSTAMVLVCVFVSVLLSGCSTITASPEACLDKIPEPDTTGPFHYLTAMSLQVEDTSEALRSLRSGQTFTVESIDRESEGVTTVTVLARAGELRRTIRDLADLGWIKGCTHATRTLEPKFRRASGNARITVSVFTRGRD